MKHPNATASEKDERGVRVVPHAALHAVGQQNKRLKARVAELEAAARSCTCDAATDLIAPTLRDIINLAVAEHNGLARLPGETGDDHLIWEAHSRG